MDTPANDYAEIELEVTEEADDSEWPNQNIFMTRGDRGKTMNPHENK